MKTNGQIFLSRKFSVFYNINCVLWIKVLRFEKFVKIKYRKPYYQNNSALRSNKTPRGAFENLHCRGLRDTIWWFPVVDKCAHNATVNRQSWKKQNKNKQKKQKKQKKPGAIRSRKLKDRQYNGKCKKDWRTRHDLNDIK